jgi:uncharacterized protein with beta-barrel porin domain
LPEGYNFTKGGFIIGVDYRITDYFAIGLMGSFAYTRTNLQPSGDIDVNTGRGGLYFTYFNHGFYINGAAYGGHTSYNTSRQVRSGLSRYRLGWKPMLLCIPRKAFGAEDHRFVKLALMERLD